MQLNIFDLDKKPKKVTKPIRLIELFAGYGSQHFALKYLGANVEHWKLCEWAVKSIQAYKDGHCIDDADYSKDMTKEELIDYLFNKGISQNYNEPMTLQQIKRQNVNWLMTVYNNIIATKNLVNIQQVKGSDLEIVDTNKYEYITTYSFPCQDLSLAGKRAGMSDTSTRSGMLWEVERILDEIKNDNLELPQILLMENVPQVIGTKNIGTFNKWKRKLEKLGYKNYHQNLIATDYGIPQTRNRTFMISILGDYSYTFPQPIPLKLKLKDMLEDEVDEKYYLSDKHLNDISNWNAYEKPLEHIGDEIAGTLTTRSGAYCSSMKLVGIYDYSKSDNFMRGKSRFQQDKDIANTILTAPKEGVVLNIKKDTKCVEVFDFRYDEGVRGRVDTEMCPTLTCKVGSSGVSGQPLLKMPEATKKGYALAHEGDGVYINRPHQKRGVVQKGKIQTLKTSCDDVGVVDNLRIRKLTPREAFRLMGVKDEDYERIAKNQSNSSLYHLAGDSIVIDVLMYIFNQLFLAKE